eukprot:g3481.t1
MVKDTRITYRRRKSYATRNNKLTAIKTPGGKLVGKVLKKKGSVPKCGDCKGNLNGIPALRPKEYKNLVKREKTVSRTYGGSLCSGCLKTRIIRAFLIEEKNLVRQVLQQKAASKDDKSKSKKKKSSKKKKKSKK